VSTYRGPVLEEADRVVVGILRGLPAPEEAYEVHVTNIPRQHLHLGDAMIELRRLPDFVGSRRRVISSGSGRKGRETGLFGGRILHAQMLVVRDCGHIGIDPIRQR
jgi:hypothetical protein